MKQADIYSEIIQDFIRPLLNSKDNDEVLLQKFKVAEIIWNYCIAKEFQLPVFDELNRIVTEQNQKHTEMKAVFDEFVKYKRTDFNQYKNFIVTLEYRLKEGGKSLYVESVHPSHLKKKLSMSKLGTKNKPATIRVRTQERAIELIALCNQKGWEVIVGIEPDKQENIDDIKKLQAGLNPVVNLPSRPSKNAPCPCGSGKKYKCCCGK